jgi:hypothetical protein
MICKCCGEDTLAEGDGNFEICPSCGWEDDPVQNADVWLAGGANFYCMREHQALLFIIRMVTGYYSRDEKDL